MSIEPLKKQDGRSLRAQTTYDEAHKKLIKSAVELFNNPLVSHEKVTVCLLYTSPSPRDERLSRMPSAA